MQRRGLLLQERADDLDRSLAGRKHHAARQVEGRVLRVAAGDSLEGLLGEAEHHAADARPIERAGAHRTRLGRRVDGASGEERRRMSARRLGRQQPFGMGGHVAIGHVAVLAFDQHVAVCINQDRTEGMVAVGLRAPGHVERAPQEALMVEGLHDCSHTLTDLVHQ